MFRTLANSLQVHFRCAQPSDCVAVKRFLVAVREEYGISDQPHYDEDLKSAAGSYHGRGGFLIVIENKKEICGTFALCPHDVKTCEFQKIYLSRELRGRGIGTLIMKYLMKCARSFGYERVLLDVNFRFRGAARIYRRLGFRKVKSPKDRKYCSQDYLLEYRFR